MMKTVRMCFLVSLVLSAFVAAAQEAVFSSISGKVEYQVPGTAWTAATVGEAVKAGTVISTGFRSSAVLKIAQCTISLKPITRLTLEELVRTEGGTQTKLFLLAGRVHAEVPPQAEKTTDFVVKSPSAVASVRGTGFYFDGANLLVDRGTVRLGTPTSQFRNVRVGEYSAVIRGSNVLVPIAVVMPVAAAKTADEAQATEGSAGMAAIEGPVEGVGGPGPVVPLVEFAQQLVVQSIAESISVRMEAPAATEIKGFDSSVIAQ